MVKSYYEVKTTLKEKQDFIINDNVVLGINPAINKQKVRKIMLPEEIEIIGKEAFSELNHLESIKGKKVFKVEIEGVSRCPELKLVKFNNLKEIAPFAFAYNENLKQINVVNAQIIDNYAFAASGLESINIPNVKNINEGAFYECYNLHTVANFENKNDNKIKPFKNLRKVEQLAFFRCKNLRNINIDHTKTSIDEKAFEATSLTKEL